MTLTKHMTNQRHPVWHMFGSDVVFHSTNPCDILTCPVDLTNVKVKRKRHSMRICCDRNQKMRARSKQVDVDMFTNVRLQCFDVARV